MFVVLPWTLVSSVCLGSSSLEGRWEQACSNGLRRIHDFNNIKSSLVESSYLDQLCTQELMDFKTTGQFSTLGSHIDFVFEKVSVRLRNEQQVHRFNLRAVCGFINWELNKFYDITGRSCDLFLIDQAFQVPARGDQRFGIFQIQENVQNGLRLLFFGQGNAELNSKTPDKRPQTYQLKPFLFQKSSK